MYSNLYQNILHKAPFGYAYHKIILNDKGIPVDFEFIEVNAEFECLTGLKSANIINRTAKQVLPGIESDEFDWIKFYGNIALNGGVEEFEQFSQPLNRWYKVQVFSPQKFHFSTVFVDVTQEYFISNASKELSEFSAENVDYKRIAERMKEISGADYTVLNLFDKHGKSFVTIAQAGYNEALTKVSDTLGFSLLGKRWDYDPIREELIKDNKTTVFKKLADVAGHKIPKQVTTLLATTFGLGEIVVVKSTKDQRVVGDFTIIFKKGKRLENQKMVEVYADLVGLLVSRIQVQTDLKQQKEEIEQFFSVNLDLLCIADTDGNFLKLNLEWQNILGYTIEELMGKKFLEFVHPDDLEATLYALSQLANQKKVLNFVNRYRCKDGSYRSIEWRSQPVGNLVYAAARDITDRIEAENVLRESEGRFKVLHNASFGGIGIHIGGVIKDCNQSLCDLSGYQMDELIGMQGLELIAPDSREYVKKQIQNNIETSYEAVGLRKDGTLYPLLISGKSIIYRGEEARVTEFRDVSELKKSEQIIKESESKLKSITNSAQDAIIMIDNEGLITFWNPAATVIFGYSIDEVMGENLHKIIAPNKYHTEHGKAFSMFQKSGKGNAIGKNLEFEGHTKNGDTIIVSLSLSGIEIDGKWNAVGIIRDVTEQKRAQNEIQHKSGLITSLLDSIPDLVFYKDLNGAYLGCNPPFIEFMGISPEEIIGKTDAQIIGENRAQLYIDYDREILKDLKPIQYEEWIRRADGSLVLYETLKTPYWGPNKELIGILGISRDITDRKLAQEKLASERERLSGIIKGTNAGTWEWNVQTGETIFNERWAEIIGYSLNEISPTSIETWAKYSNPDDLKYSGELLDKHFNGELDYYECEVRMKHKNGNWVWVLDRGRVTSRTSDGKPLVMMGTHQDITERKKSEEQLRESENRFRSLFEQTHDAVFILDINGKHIAVNNRACELLGYSESELLNLSVNETSAELEKSKDIFNRIVNGENVPLYERKFKRKDGSEVVTEVSVMLIKDNQGNPLHVQSVMRDITERKHNEEQLRSVKEQFEIAINGTNDGIWDWNLKTNELFLSKRWKSMLGYEDHELPNDLSTFDSLLFEEDIERVKYFIDQYLIGNIRTYSVEFRMKHKDGSIRWIHAKGEALRDSYGNPYRMAGSHSDITEKKKFEQTLVENKFRLELAMDAGEHGFWDWDLNSNETYFSPTYFRMLGYEVGELPMNFDTFNQILLPADKEIVMPIIQKHIEMGEPYEVEFRLLCKDGSYRWIAGKGKSYMNDITGKPFRVVGVHIDIDTRKNAEEALRESEAKLRELNSTKDKFFSIISHDLKGVFNALLGISDLMVQKAKTNDTSNFSEFSSILYDAANKGYILLENLLNWARIQTGHIAFNPKKVLFNTIVQIVFELNELSSKKKEVELVTQIDEDILVNADSFMIETVLRNLVSNAIKFSNPGGKVIVRAERSNDSIIVSVSDNGVGISKGNIDKLFKIETSFTSQGTDNEHGTGLGLILCKEFIDKHKGRIWAESEEGKGTTISFTIPL
jgi:PAS domain S-box-containing protein